MTLLIDPPNATGHGRLWSHLASDTSYAELHDFAARLGIPARGFDRDHYDIPAERHQAVVAAGALPVTSRELVERLAAAGLRRRKADTLGPRRPGRMLLRPPRLHAGDRVAVVATSGMPPAEEIRRGVGVLRSWGLDVAVLDPPGHATLSYLAATDRQRAEDLTTAWCDPDTRAVFCARGGYGAQRMVDLLDFRMLAEAGPKVLVGFSDVTALHLAFALRLGLATVHGPVVTSLGRDPDSTEHLRRLLFGVTPTVLAGGSALVPGRAEGVLVGGNLSMVAAGLGTPDAGSARDGIAVLEDIEEDVYRLDRMITQLLRAGWFDGVRGIVLGGFARCAPAAELRVMFADRLGVLGVPVLLDGPVGHAPGANLAFPYGVPARLDASASTLTLKVAPLL